MGLLKTDDARQIILLFCQLDLIKQENAVDIMCCDFNKTLNIASFLIEWNNVGSMVLLLYQKD